MNELLIALLGEADKQKLGGEGSGGAREGAGRPKTKDLPEHPGYSVAKADHPMGSGPLGVGNKSFSKLDIYHGGEKIGSIRNSSGYKDQTIPGAKYVASRQNVERWQGRNDAGHHDRVSNKYASTQEERDASRGKQPHD